MSRLMLKTLAALVLASPLAALASGPLSLCSGSPPTPLKYSGAGSVVLNYDTATPTNALGTRTKTEADTIVNNSIALWNNVTTATVTLSRGADLTDPITHVGVDVTTANVNTFYSNFGDGLNPVIYDTDGSILDSLLGVGAKSSVLGFAGSAWNTSPCQYVEGRAVISGYIAISDATLTNVFAHEIGHLIGMDHTQLDSTQGLASSNYPLMYPIAYRTLYSLHEDDAAGISYLYPDATVTTTYGELSGNLQTALGVPVLGANVYAQGAGGVFSSVSDFREEGNGYFHFLLPPGTYTLRAEPIDTQFTGGSGVGPHSGDWNGASFQPPLYSIGGSEPSQANPLAPTITPSGPIATVTHPQTITITAGCVGTATFKLNGTGTVGGNCGVTPSISLGSSQNPAPANQAVTFTATVSGSSGTPTGTIIFRDNGVAISGCGGLAMVNGSATCSPMLGAGTHPITAVYSGNSTYGGITSSTVPQVMNGATATVSLGTSQNPAAVGSLVTFTVNVSGASGTPTGTVNFLDGAGSVAGCSAVALSSGTATCSTGSLTVATHSMSAVYSGNSTYNAGTSNTVSQAVVNPGTPSITLGSTANPSTVGQYVTYTAVVSGAFGTPAGTIVFRDNGTVINGCGGLVMTNGRASCTIGNQALGTHSMTAVYSGGGLYSGITSSTLPQVVNVAKANTPSITLGSSVNPSTVGQYVELTAVVSGGAGTPTGTLVFLDNGDTISGCGGLTMTSGQATCTPGSLALGTHSITTVYSGDSTYNGVTSSTLPQTVNAAKANTPSFTLATSQNPSTAGQPVTFTAVLSGGAGTVTGNVVFRDNGLTISGCGGLALTAGHVTCAPRLSAGAHAITGIYLGDANYNGITSSTVPQTAQ